MMSLILMNSVFKWNRIVCRKLMTLRKEEGCFSKFQKTTSNSNFVLKASLCAQHEVKELQIPVPYGHIAAKAWGQETGTPVLAFHGWLDNAGTFDKLIPLLLPSLYVVAIDAPGHGLSSHKPPGCFYSCMDTMIDFKRVVDHLQWTKFNIIGHSLGGAYAQLYASLFPETVEKIVVLDTVKLSSRRPEQLPELTRSMIELNLKLEEKMLNDPPLYSMESAVQRLKEGIFNEITDDSAKILIKRGTKFSKCGKGLVFTRDLRAKTVERFQMRSHDSLKGYMSALKCEMLLIRANNTHPMYMSTSPEVLDDFIEIYRKCCKKFFIEKVEGNHFVHLNHPEHIAPLINSFLH